MLDSANNMKYNISVIRKGLMKKFHKQRLRDSLQPLNVNGGDVYEILP